MIDVTVDPPLDKILMTIVNAKKEMLESVDKAIKDGALELNKEAKFANPQDTGLSRRAWGVPQKIGNMVWAVVNGVSYTGKIFYGKKKPSKYIGAPKGVSITPGKNFVEVVQEAFERIQGEVERQILTMLKGLIKI